MPLRSLVSSFVSSGLAAVLLLTAPTTAQAQSLIDFLWGGSQEWGGGRQTVSFNPKYTPGQIIVSFGDRRLYLITHKGQATSYPIAVPREKSRWQGTTKISNKRENPSWRPTPEMLRENPKLPTWVPGGHPMNPLGVRALYLGTSAYRIHGTDAPWTIGQAVSQGCIRMFNKDVLDLYPRVPVGMRVTVTWERFTTQTIASSYDDRPVSNDDAAEPFQPAAYQPSSTRRTIRNLPPLPRSVRDAQNAAVRNEHVKEPARAASIELPVEKPSKAEKPKKAAAIEKPARAKPAKVKTAARVPEPQSSASTSAKQEKTDKTPRAATSQGAKSAIEAAKAAAAAAAKAAEAARKAAEAAKKAAEDAKRAAEPSKETAKRAAL